MIVISELQTDIFQSLAESIEVGGGVQHLRSIQRRFMWQDGTDDLNRPKCFRIRDDFIDVLLQIARTYMMAATRHTTRVEKLSKLVRWELDKDARLNVANPFRL